MSRLEYVKVVWMDHCGYDDAGWVSYNEEELTNMAKGVTCITVGPLLMETKDSYVVGHTVGDNGQISGGLAILKALVKEFYYLKTKSKTKK